MISEARIKKEAWKTSAYESGCRYYRLNKVESLRYNKIFACFEAKVRGTYFYSVNVSFDEKNELLDYDCNCPAFRKYPGACKHVVAVLKAIQANWGAFINQGIYMNAATKEFLAFFRQNSFSGPEEYQEVNSCLQPTYCFAIADGEKRNWLEFHIGAEKMYVLKDIKSFLDAVMNKKELVFGKNFTYSPAATVFDEQSRAILEMLKTAYLDEQQFSKRESYSYNEFLLLENRKFNLNNTNLINFFQIMAKDSFAIAINGGKISESAKIIAGRPPFKLDIEKIQGGVKTSLDMERDGYYGLDREFRYIYHNGFIYKVDSEFSFYVQPLLKFFNQSEQPSLLIPEVEMPEFFSTAVPALEKIARVNLDETLQDKFYRAELEIVLYLDRLEAGISVRVEFRYGELVFNPAVEGGDTPGAKVEERIIIRAVAQENKLLSILKKYGFARDNDKEVFTLRDEEDTFNFLQGGIPKITALATIFYSEDFKNIQIKPYSKIAAAVSLNTTTDLLEISWHYEDIEPQELLGILSAYKLKKKYYRLKNGAFIPLESSELQTAAELIEQLGLSSKDISQKVIELPKYRAMYIDSLYKEKRDLQLESNSAFRKMVQDISKPQDLDFTLPVGINGQLRGYQKTGFKWLKSLAYYGLGGILADDMGLGKTLQVITFILAEKSSQDKPSLVIAPTSLVYNWQEEVAKFAPDLKVVIVSGSRRERQERLRESQGADLLVTSYALIKRDIDIYENRSFKYCFLDEAQQIKNPNTLNAKAAKQIKAQGYFALTGTPIENNLTELWSIFDFLMPGYLLSHKKFSERYEKPIVKEGDSQALNELGRHIKPFILRRMKKEVLKELPEKIESKMINEMSSEQSKIYTAYLLKAKQEFEKELLVNGFSKSQIKILSILTRLRQICCHPALFIDNYTGKSGKLDMLMEILGDAVAGGHRILLFSQFTSMLSIIKQELEGAGIEYHYLDGGTAAEERMRLVNAFNAGEKEVFLISLKAGGTGLNLTGADMVIHYDPWWNPAVEDQATDRAYRIGQKNAVQVFKLITKGTIEEKIYELQQKKKELIDAVIKPGENFLTKMSEAEIRALFD